MTRSVDVDELERLYYDERLSQAEVAQRLGVSEATVNRRMADHWLDARSTGPHKVKESPNPEAR